MARGNRPSSVPRTPGGIKRNVGIILKKINLGPIGPVTKKVGKKQVVVFGNKAGGTKLAQPIQSAFNQAGVVRAVRKLTNAPTAGPTRKVAKPRPGGPVNVAKKTINRKRTG